MSKFVKELSEEVEDLEKKIEEKKKEIQTYSTKGATSDNQRRELKIVLISLDSLLFIKNQLNYKGFNKQNPTRREKKGYT